MYWKKEVQRSVEQKRICGFVSEGRKVKYEVRVEYVELYGEFIPTADDSSISDQTLGSEDAHSECSNCNA